MQRAVKLGTPVLQVVVGGAGVEDRLPVQCPDNQGFIQARLGDSLAIRRGNAALPTVLNLAFVPAVIGVGHVALVFEGPRPHGDVEFILPAQNPEAAPTK